LVIVEPSKLGVAGVILKGLEHRRRWIICYRGELPAMEFAVTAPLG